MQNENHKITVLSVSYYSSRHLSRVFTNLIDKCYNKNDLHFVVIDNTNGQDKNLINLQSNDYDVNRDEIKTELRICISELNDLKDKLGYWEKKKSKRLISFINQRLEKPFEIKKQDNNAFITFLKKYPYRLFITTYDDVWEIYGRLYEIISQVENIKKNKEKSL